MSQRYTAAVVGAGSGGKLSLEALAASPRFELLAVTDWSQDARLAAQTRYPGLAVFADHRDMFAACPTDIVCVSTWPPSHLAVTRDALQLPLKGILVEKPLADTYAAGRTLLDLVRSRNLPMAVPHGLLVADHVRHIFERVHAGEIGDLKLIEIQCAGWDIINAGIHWLNFVVMLTRQEPVDFVMAAVDAGTRTYRDGMQVETLAVTYIQMHSGLRVVMNTGDYVKPSEPDKGTLFRLVGTLGMLDFYGWESRYRLLNAANPHGRTFDVEPGPGTRHQRHLENLAAHIDRGVPDYNVAESSLKALELCEAAYVSARHGGVTVPLPLEQFAPPPPVDWAPGQPYSGQDGGRDGRKLPPE